MTDSSSDGFSDVEYAEDQDLRRHSPAVTTTAGLNLPLSRLRRPDGDDVPTDPEDAYPDGDALDDAREEEEEDEEGSTSASFDDRTPNESSVSRFSPGFVRKQSGRAPRDSHRSATPMDSDELPSSRRMGTGVPLGAYGAAMEAMEDRATLRDAEDHDVDDEDEEDMDLELTGDLALAARDPDVRQLLAMVRAFQPEAIELETQLKPFIPPYIPAVGTPDAFLKPPRPDGKPCPLGIYVLDEPALAQSDPSAFQLQLRAASKKGGGSLKVHSIERPDKNPEKVSTWIETVRGLHAQEGAGAANVHGLALAERPMPDLEQLMHPWEEDMKDGFAEHGVPPHDIDMPLKDYVAFACALLDVPVHDGRVLPSLHHLCKLYAAMRESQQAQQGNPASGAPA